MENKELNDQELVRREKLAKYKKADKTWRVQIPYITDDNDNAKMTYQRIFIRKK